ncbi:alpha/beta fold hydrolase [Nonomuraea sp. NPDC050556]|uniref:alpha/beta fold hydrolase n=1 Tax=Nonomuraea sp. NPDC050556 TaxID=3364369 RepID=UPI00378EDCD9
MPDGRRLHYVSRGAGELVVVFESGLGGTRLDWGLVLDGVAVHTRAVAYDRAGLGRSDPDPSRRDVARLAEDLGHLLDGLGGSRFVLVGHSLGGPIIRACAALRPERIAGLVLVDPADESLDMYYSLTHRLLVRGICLAAELLSRAGYRTVPGGPRPAVPAAQWAGAERELTSPAALRAARREASALAGGLRSLRDHPVALPPVPVTVISGTRSRAPLVAAHRAFAAALPHGRHVLAQRSGHMVHHDQPDLVLAEIAKLTGQ